MWSPGSTDLGIVQVNQSFSFTIQYTYEDPFTLTIVNAPITLSVQQRQLNSLTNSWESVSGSLPPTIQVSSGTFSGYLPGTVFDQTSVSYTLKDDETQSVLLDGKKVPNFWKTLDARKASIGHIYSFKPDRRSAFEYNIRATASGTDVGTVSRTYTLTVQHPSYTPDANELRKRI